MITVVVLGGYGNFGAIISQHLANSPNLQLVIAGRDKHKAETLATRLGAKSCCVNSMASELASTLRALDANVVINCAGPFQNAGYEVALAAIEAGAHYIDIADGRRFVSDIKTLDSAAKRAGVVVISGASSVPALSSAVIDAHLDRFASLFSIDTGISASERIPGAATIAAVLSYAGQAINVTRNGRRQRLFGWQGLHRERFSAPAGRRWQCHCDVPDIELFPEHYDSVQSVSFSAGLGLSATHLGTWLLAGLARVGLLRRPERLATGLRRAALHLERFGNGVSAMYVRMSGTDHSGRPLTWRWELIAQSNEGAQVPCLAAVALCRKMGNGDSLAPGARACVGLVSLDEYMAVLEGLAITTCSERS